jgi:predicted DNA-binding transcriptional regulator AlpA
MPAVNPNSVTARRRVQIPSDYPRAGRLADQRLFETVLGIGTSSFERLKAAKLLPPAIRIGRTLRWDEATIAHTAATGVPPVTVAA